MQFITRFVRTVVPFIVAWFVALGVDVDAAAIEEGLVAIIGALYYALVAWLEPRFPWIGWFLGIAKEPKYDLA